jgi:copper homeostasis protein
VPLLEVICCTLADCLAAESGGAGRIELVRHPARGGFTPPLDLVEAVLVRLRIPVRVILREDENHEIPPSAAPSLHASACLLARLPLDGVVLGFRRAGQPDLALTQSVLAEAPTRRATFHHAFEELENPLEAIASLKTLPSIDRILSHGGPGSWQEKAARLAQYSAAAAPQIQILAGGGLTEDAITLLRRLTPLTEFHAGRAARATPDPNAPVSESRVARLVSLLNP